MNATRFEIPIEVRSANDIEGAHRMKLAAIAKRERSYTFRAAMGAGLRLWLKSNGPPFVVTFTRVIQPRGRKYDEGENDRLGFKHVRDEVARILGVNDSPNSPITWLYGEPVRGKYGAAIVEIEGTER